MGKIRTIDMAKAAAEAIKREPGRQRPHATVTTDAMQRAAQEPGPVDKSAWPSKQGPGKSGL